MRIKDLLKEKGMSQKNLANKIGITEVGMTKLLSSENPRLETLKKISSALNVEVWELLTPTTDKVEFTAMIKDGDEMMCFYSIEELKKWVDGRKGKEV